MESSYMGGLDGSDPLGKAVIWSRTEQDVDDLEELQHEQVPFSPLPTHSSTTSTTTTSTEDTAWDELDGNHDPSFHVLYTGHGSPSTKAKIRQSLAQAMSTFYTTTQQQRQRRQRQQSSSLPQQRFNVVTSEALATDTYEDNGLALWETDATWSLPSMSILLPCDTDDSYYLPQTLHTKMLPQLDASIDLVIYFCNQRHGPLEQDFAALAKLQLPVLPLIIHPASDPDDPPSLSSSFSSTSSQLVNINKPPPSWTVLRETIAAYLHQYHIHCFNVTEIHPEVPGFISNTTPCSPSLCHILSANEIMHVDQFTSLDTRTTFRLMTNVRKYNERRQATQRKPWYGWHWVALLLMLMALWTASPLTSRNTLAPLPHMTMAPGYESPDADMYHHFTLVPDEKGASQVVNQAQLVWDQGGIWTLTKTDWTAHVPSPCKMNWDTDMNLTLRINTNDDAGQWQTTTLLFTLPWIPCHSIEHTYYPHHDRKSGNDCGSTSYFALTPYQHDVLHQWWLQLKAWTKIGIHSLVNGAKKLHRMTDSLYHLQ